MDEVMDCDLAAPSFDPTQPSTSASVYQQPHTPRNRVLQPPMSMPGTPRTPGTPMSMASPLRPQNVDERRVQQRKGRVNNWLGLDPYQINPQFAPNGPLSRAASVAGSTMSCQSEVSYYSLMSHMSQLSVNTDIANHHSWMGYGQQAYYQPAAPNALSTVSSSSTTENENPNKVQDVARLVATSVDLLKSDDQNNHLKALRTLLQLVEQNSLTMVIDPKLSYLMFDCLFNKLFLHPDRNETIEEMRQIHVALAIIIHCLKSKDFLRRIEQLHKNWKMNERTEGLGLYYVLMRRAARFETPYLNKAWVLLSMLLSQGRVKRDVYSSERNPLISSQVVIFLVNALKGHEVMGPNGLVKMELKQQPKNVAINALRLVVQHSQETLAIAATHGAVDALLMTIKNDTIHESVMYIAAQTLNLFLAHNQCGTHLVQIGGIDILCGLLSHGSTRLLHELLSCLMNVADLPVLKDVNTAESIVSVIQLLGASDPVIAERATGFLMNVGLYNKSNKVVMVNKRTPEVVFQILRMTDGFRTPLPTKRENENMEIRVKNIYDNCLGILSNLTKMSQDDPIDAAKEACKQIAMSTDTAYPLLYFFGAGNCYRRRLAITILKRVIDTVPSYADLFLNWQDARGDALPTVLLKRIWESFEDYNKLNMRHISSQGTSKSDEQRKDHELIVVRASGLLKELVKHNFAFLSPVIEIFRNQANPLVLLSLSASSDQMIYEWLTFVNQVSMCPQSQFLLLETAEKQPANVNFLRMRNQQSQHPGIREVTQRTLELIERLAAQRASMN